MGLRLLIILAVVSWKPSDCRRLLAADADEDNLSIIEEQSRLLSSIIPTAFSQRVSERCRIDSLIYVESIRGSKEWAWKMLGASGKLSELYLNANTQSMGHFDQCLAVETSHFLGKYCTVFLKSDTKSVVDLWRMSAGFGTGVWAPGISNSSAATSHSPSVGLCVPSSCNANDVQASVAQVLAFQLGNHSSSITITTEENFCYDKTSQSLPFDVADILVGLVCSALAALILAGTCLEGWSLYTSHDQQQQYEHDAAMINSIWMRAIFCFSLIGNGRRLFSSGSSASNDSGSFTCVYGIRTLTMLWVVVGHVWIQGVIQYNQNPAGLLEDGRKWQWQAVANGTVAVDGFFLLGGLLVSYHLLQHLEQTKGKLRLVGFYLHRYVRLIPVYIAVLAFVSTIIVHMGSGPNWFNMKFIAANCRRVWWQHLLLITNFVPKGANEQCMTEAWYLSSDFQLFLISPLLVYPVWRWKNKGLTVLLIATFFSLAGNVVKFYTKGMPPTSMLTRPLSMNKSLVDFWIYYYPQPWFRSPPYFAGVFLGYILHVTRDQTVRLHTVYVVIGWVFSCATCLLVVFGLAPYLNEDKVPDIHPLISTLYGSFHRFAWGISLAWIVFACVRGYGGIINDFLSWQFFVPLGRLSYCTYLVHYNVINVYFAQKRTPSYYTPAEQFYWVCGTWVVSVAFALLLSLTVEMPFHSLEKMISFRSRTKSVTTITKRCQSHSCGKINQAFTVA